MNSAKTANKAMQTKQYKQSNTNKAMQTKQYKQSNTNKAIHNKAVVQKIELLLF
jgi:hypothetical protein